MVDLLRNTPFKIGVNYWPASSAIKMWSQWNSSEILEDFRQMSAAGLDLVRFFIFTPDFVKLGSIDPVQLKHYGTLLEHLKTANLQAIPSLFIGHMSGQNYRVDGWDESTFFTDPGVLEQQKSFIRAILDLSRDSSQIAGWCLSNEMPNDFPGRSPEEVTLWFTEISRFIRELDSRPLIFGDGVWSPEITGHGRQNKLEPSANYQLRDLAPLQDILGVHFYPRYDDFWPQAYTAGFRMLMAASWKKEIFLEEFGHSIAMGSEENQALYYREVLFSALQTGGSAGMSWCWTDFELPDLRPYLHNTFEMRFGLRRLDGSFRPALQEMTQIKELSRTLSQEGWRLSDRSDTVIIPSNYFHPHPFDWDRDTDEKYELFLHTYGALASCGALVKYVHEPGVSHRSQDHEIHKTNEASFKDQPGLLWLSAFKRLSAPFWNTLLEMVEQGSSLYLSFANDHWIIDLDELLGLKSNLRFGLPDFYPDETLTLSSPDNWAGWGDEDISLQLGPHRQLRNMSFLPAEVISAEVLLEDSKGRPMLIRKTRGKGSITFALFPFEMLMLKSGTEQVRNFVTRLYACIREDQLDPGSSCFTSAGEFLKYERDQESREFLFNHAWEQRAFQVRKITQAKTIKKLRVELPPKSFCEIVDTTENVSTQLEFVSAIGMAK